MRQSLLRDLRDFFNALVLQGKRIEEVSSFEMPPENCCTEFKYFNKTKTYNVFIWGGIFQIKQNYINRDTSASKVVCKVK